MWLALPLGCYKWGIRANSVIPCGLGHMDLNEDVRDLSGGNCDAQNLISVFFPSRFLLFHRQLILLVILIQQNQAIPD